MATTRSNISASVGEIRVDGDVSLARPGRQYRIDDEIVTLRAFARGLHGTGGQLRDQWLVTRGDAGTIAASHASGADVFVVAPAVVTSDSLSLPLPYAGESSGGSGLPPVTATVSDRFARADGATLGGNWETAGTWGISDEAAYLTDTSFPAWATMESYIADAIVAADITVPDDWNGSNYGFGLTLRRADASNYLRLWNNSGNVITLQSWIAGTFGDTVDATGFAWVAGQTYRLSVTMYGNTYLIYIDGVLVIGAPSVDTNNNDLAATKHGLFSAGVADGPRWDNFEVYR